MNLVENINPIKLVSSNNTNQDQVSFLKFDFANPKVFFASCGPRTDEFKLCTGASCDQVMNFQSSYDEYGHVVFVMGYPQFSKRGGQKSAVSKKQVRLVGFSNGYLKLISLESLSVKHCFKLQINRDAGEVVTCGQFSANNKNFAVGTSHGTLFFGNIIQGKKLDANYAKITNLGRCNKFDTSN